jgi:hypothetical protein
MTTSDEMVQCWTRFLEADWEEETGFLRLIHRGIFDPRLGEIPLKKLKEMELPSEGPTDRRIERRFISAVWMIPLFLVCNKGRAVAESGNLTQYDEISNGIAMKS